MSPNLSGAPDAELRSDGDTQCWLQLPCDASPHLTPENNSRQTCALAQSVGQSGDVIVITSASGIIQFVNPAFERATGYSLNDAIGRTLALINSATHPPEFFAQLWATISSGHVFRGVITNRCKNGKLYQEEITISPIYDGNGDLSHFISSGRDVSQRILSDVLLEHQANHDALTGLPNRSLFLDRLGQALRHGQRESGNVALLFVDLNRFKAVNDGFGHDIGDQVLIKVAERLLGAVREKDSVARIGGDEFAVVLEGLKTPSDSGRVAAALIAALDSPLEINGQPLTIGSTIGIATYPEDGDSVELLLKRADIAMYHGKSAGHSSYTHFSAVMEGELLENRSMATALRSAHANGEFEVHYQSIVALKDQRLLAVEALLRWNSPLHGSVPPARFIPMLETSKQIGAAGKWLLASACRNIRALDGDDLSSITLSINLSHLQFRDPKLPTDVAEILLESGLEPRQLQLEIAESTLIADTQTTGPILQALKTLGVRLAVDDFGIGCCSLTNLRRFPLDTLKIARPLVAELETSAEALWLVKTIVNLADSLGIETTAKGVETAGQMALIAALGCSSMQGYWFNRPSPWQQLRAGWRAKDTLHPGSKAAWQ